METNEPVSGHESPTRIRWASGSVRNPCVPTDLPRAIGCNRAIIRSFCCCEGFLVLLLRGLPGSAAARASWFCCYPPSKLHQWPDGRFAPALLQRRGKYSIAILVCQCLLWFAFLQLCQFPLEGMSLTYGWHKSNRSANASRLWSATATVYVNADAVAMPTARVPSNSLALD